VERPGLVGLVRCATRTGSWRSSWCCCSGTASQRQPYRCWPGPAGRWRPGSAKTHSQSCRLRCCSYRHIRLGTTTRRAGQPRSAGYDETLNTPGGWGVTAPRTAPRAGQAPAVPRHNPVTTPRHHPTGGGVGGCSSVGLPGAATGLVAELHIQLDGQVGRCRARRRSASPSVSIRWRRAVRSASAVAVTVTVRWGSFA